MTKAKYVPGMSRMPIEKPMCHFPAQLCLWAVWHPITKKGKKTSVGVFAPEYQGTPMLFATKEEAKKHIGWPIGSPGLPVKVTLRFSRK